MTQSNTAASSDVCAPRGRDLWWPLCVVAAFVISLLAMAPLLQLPPQYHIDWLHTLSEVYARRLRLGVDVIFTFGPWGFTWGGYHPKTFPLTCVVWTVVALMIGWAAYRIASPKRLNCAPFRAGLALTGVALLLQGLNSEYPDARLFLLSFLLVIRHFLVAPRPVDALALALTATVAFSGTIKFPYLITGLLATGAIAFDSLLVRRGRGPALIPPAVYAVTFLLAWAGSGQRLGDIPAYLKSSFQMTAGYTEAMGFTGRFAAVEIALYVLTAAGSLLLAAGWRTTAAWRERWVLLLTIGVLELLVFRASYVRHDFHGLIGSALLGSFVPLLVLALWPALNGRASRRLAIGTIAGAVMLQTLASYRYDRRISYSPLETAKSVRHLALELSRLARSEPSTPALAYQQWLGELRDHNPLPPMRGTVDLVPYETDILLAHGLDYVPRPTLQSYAAFTPALARANADYYAGPNAPRNVLLRVESIDSRLPTLEDNLLWLELLKRYRLAGTYNRYLHLVPRGLPRTIKLELLEEKTARLDEPVSVPAAPDGALIWAQFATAARPAGRAVSQLYKTPPLWMTLELPGRAPIHQRFLVANGAEGFLLSPLVMTNQTFAALLERPAVSDALAPLRPASVTLWPPRNAVARAYFNPEMRVKFYALRFDPAD